MTLGNYTFDAARTAVLEKYAEVGGRDARVIELRGVMEGLESQEELEAALDAVLRAASDQGDATPLVLRPGRVLYVRRSAFTREAIQGGGAGQFALTLEAQNPYEMAETPTVVTREISGSGRTMVLETAGNVHALPIIAMTSASAVRRPAFSDGLRTIIFDGAVEANQTLTLDGEAGKAMLAGVDVTPYTTGRFPRLQPGGTGITYTDGGSAAPIVVTVTYRDRWW